MAVVDLDVALRKKDLIARVGVVPAHGDHALQFGIRCVTPDQRLEPLLIALGENKHRPRRLDVEGAGSLNPDQSVPVLAKQNAPHLIAAAEVGVEGSGDMSQNVIQNGAGVLDDRDEARNTPDARIDPALRRHHRRTTKVP